MLFASYPSPDGKGGRRKPLPYPPSADGSGNKNQRYFRETTLASGDIDARGQGEQFDTPVPLATVL